MTKGIDYTGISVVALCHDGKGKYLLELRSEKCRDERLRWSNVGGGGLEAHETLEEAVRREIKEECGADVLVIEPLGFREVFRESDDGTKSHWIAFDFKVEIDPAQVSVREPEMCLEHRWVALSEFPEPLHSQFPHFLEKYRDRL
ncbi:MAG TPA: NUDIX hydrolase [Candidatus Paceibacterota bacterium]|nr:NUDIX hydrolase [Candidatus Paceibacterota bacterium]